MFLINLFTFILYKMSKNQEQTTDTKSRRRTKAFHLDEDEELETVK